MKSSCTCSELKAPRETTRPLSYINWHGSTGREHLRGCVRSGTPKACPAASLLTRCKPESRFPKCPSHGAPTWSAIFHDEARDQQHRAGGPHLLRTRPPLQRAGERDRQMGQSCSLSLLLTCAPFRSTPAGSHGLSCCCCMAVQVERSR